MLPVNYWGTPDLCKKDANNIDTKLQKTITITNTKGLHARASAKFVKCAELFDAETIVSCKGQDVPGTSILGLMMLAACPGTEIIISTSGPQSEQALIALCQLVASKFDED